MVAEIVTEFWGVSLPERLSSRPNFASRASEKARQRAPHSMHITITQRKISRRHLLPQRLLLVVRELHLLLELAEAQVRRRELLLRGRELLEDLCLFLFFSNTWLIVGEL